MLKEIIKTLPKNPGIYIFKDKLENIIYIGKAKNLKNRISSYFLNKHTTSPKTKVLVKNITKIDYIIVDTELEALLLENKLIKKHKPKYNIDLKDSKTYAYIKITDEKIPKITFTRKITKTGDYFGPYTNSEIRRELFFLVTKIFGIVTKSTFSNKSTLNYQIGMSPAKTIDEINIKEYNKNVKLAKEFLLGKNINQIISKLKEKMQLASKDENYEIALEIKKQIETIENSFEKQKVDLIKKHDQDIIALIENNIESKSIIIILNISKGTITSKKDYLFETSENLLEEFIKMYYSKNTIPSEIIINQKISDEKKSIEEYLQKLSSHKVEIITPQKGEKLELVKLAEKNAQNLIKNNPLKELQVNLQLQKIPKIIECFDMSNFGKNDLVGAMTRWVDLKPDKSGYRKYEIKKLTGKNDDYASINEVITRRYTKLKTENLEYPNLIIIDGGKGHLNTALNALNKLNLEIPIISIAKGKNRDKNEIYLVGKDDPLIFDNNSEMMLNLRKIRDSVHNFVISYNRSKRKIK